MRLLRIPQPFDHQDFIYELKLDGFRALAVVKDGSCELVSRNGHVFRQFDSLRAAIARSIRGRAALLDGEIACFDGRGRSDFYGLLFKRKAPAFCAFDLIEWEGKDLRDLPLRDRKQRLRVALPNLSDERVRYVDHVDGRGREFYALACRRDLEGIVAKWAPGRYQSGPGTSWLKIKNPSYSQMDGRHELFESRRGAFEGRRRPTGVQPVTLALR